MSSLSWRDLALCLSLANLCYLNAWEAVQSLEAADGQYFQKFPFLEIFFVTTAGVLLLALLFSLSLNAVRRWQNPGLTIAAQCIFLLSLNIPARFIETQAMPPGVHSGRAANSVITLGFVALDVLILIAPALILTRRSRMPVTAARTVVLIFAPLLPILLIQAAWCSFRSPSAVALQDKPLATHFPHRSTAASRVVWLVFDEMDERFVSQRRSPSIMPEFDRFRSEAFEAVKAHSPARWTLVSMPALISGRLLSEAEPDGVDDLTLTLKDGGRKLQWSAQPNVFSRAREAGLNTGLVGWYHPYCRVLNSSLTECWWQPYLSAAQSTWRRADGRTLDVVGTLLTQARRQLGAIALPPYIGSALGEDTGGREREWDRQQQHVDYLQIRRHALAMVTNRDLGLVLVHWPVPHPVSFYNRSTRRVASDFYDNYIENLALTDRALGELRMAMERAGVWDRTSVLISSDHGLRNEAGPDGAREAQVTGGGSSLPSVPFLLKLPSQDHALQYGPAFNTVLTHDLILSLLRGELTSPESVRRWLDANRARFPIN